MIYVEAMAYLVRDRTPYIVIHSLLGVWTAWRTFLKKNCVNSDVIGFIRGRSAIRTIPRAARQSQWVVHSTIWAEDELVLNAQRTLPKMSRKTLAARIYYTVR
jgi:hypothetical protein